MNLPKGPDTLCFDKDEFMKVRAGGSAPWSRAVGGLPSFALRGLSSGLSCALPGPRPPRTGPRRGDLAALRSESLGLGFGRCSVETALL